MIRLDWITLQRYRNIFASEDADLFGSSCFIFSVVLIGFWNIGVYFNFINKENFLHSLLQLDGFLLFFVSLIQHCISDNFDTIFSLKDDDIH